MKILKVAISNIGPGVILGKDVLTNDGQVLLGNGTTVAQKHLDILKRREIEEIFIISNEDDAIDAGNDDITNKQEEPVSNRSRVVKKLERVFSKVIDNEDMKKLFDLAESKAEQITIN